MTIKDQVKLMCSSFTSFSLVQTMWQKMRPAIKRSSQMATETSTTQAPESSHTSDISIFSFIQNSKSSSKFNGLFSKKTKVNKSELNSMSPTSW